MRTEIHNIKQDVLRSKIEMVLPDLRENAERVQPVITEDWSNAYWNCFGVNA